MDPDRPHRGNVNNPLTLNPYVYVGCNPANSTDPSGRSADDFGDFWSLMEGCGSATFFFVEVSLATNVYLYAAAYGGPAGELAWWTMGGLLACGTGMFASAIEVDAALDVPIF
jgi:hypothetical protein